MYMRMRISYTGTWILTRQSFSEGQETVCQGQANPVDDHEAHEEQEGVQSFPPRGHLGPLNIRQERLERPILVVRNHQGKLPATFRYRILKCH